MKITLECTYCGHSWMLTHYAFSMKKEMKCPLCKDKNIKAKKHSKIDFYDDTPREDAYIKNDEDDDGGDYGFD